MTTNETQVKRFTAPTMTRALELVRDEMGPEAVILSSKKVKGGVEVLISSEPDLPTRGVSERRAFGQNFDTDVDSALDSDTSWQSQAGIEQAAEKYRARVDNQFTDQGRDESDRDGLADAIERARERMFEAKRKAISEDKHVPQASAQTSNTKSDYSMATAASSHVTQNVNVPDENEQKLEALKAELSDLRMILEEQMWSKQAEQPSVTPDTVPLSENLQTLTSHLSRLGITAQLIDEVSRGIDQHTRISEAWQHSLTSLAQKIDIAPELDTQNGGTFAFIGPTGVGKTTTLAKLAARYAIEHGTGKVALVSMDTHRVGAVEQLKALGKILDVPVRTVNSANSLMTVLASLRHFPLVLIDTAGFRQGDVKLKAQLAQLDQSPSVKRLLVLSSLSQLQTLKASIHAYQPRKNIDGCVISKLDEAASLGESLSAVIQHELPVAYVTDGQDIPRDVHLANRHQLVASAVTMAKRVANQASATI